MKYFFALVLLLIMPYVQSMDQTLPNILEPSVAKNDIDKYLWFVLSRDKSIAEYGCKNMEFFLPPKDFLNKKMLTVVPLQEADKKAIALAMSAARHNRKEQKVSYTLEGTQFTAAIKYRSKYEQYRIKVTQQ